MPNGIPNRNPQRFQEADPQAAAETERQRREDEAGISEQPIHAFLESLGIPPLDEEYTPLRQKSVGNL